jgi:spherulation-specific family 4 protein
MKTIVAGLLVVLATACASSGGRRDAGGDADAERGSADAAASTGGAGAAGTPLDAGSAGSGAAGAAGADAGAAEAGATNDARAATDTGATTDAGASDATRDAVTGSSAGTIVPLYTDPSDSSWSALVTARQAHPTVRVVAIVNPDSGPGASKSNAYTTGIAALVAADIQVIGYVATGYASHSLASMQTEIDTWRTFYPQIDGIFFDEQSNLAADVDYYRTLSQYAKAHNLVYTVGNPGTDTAEAFIGALDTMLIYESKGLPTVASLGGWHAKYPPVNFGVIPYGASFDAAFVASARKVVGFIYIQNDDLPNPWDTLPPFFGELLGALE